jgi:hypothetical protein
MQSPYLRYLARRLKWATKGVWGQVGNVSLIVGSVLAILLWRNAKWTHEHISEEMNAFISGAIPLLTGGSVFLVRWFLSPYFLLQEDTRKLTLKNRTIRNRLNDLKARRPKFRYEFNQSIIEPQIVQSNNKFFGQVHFRINYVNKGPGIAHKLKLTVYFCWLNDVENIATIGGPEGQATWEEGDFTGCRFYAVQPAKAIRLPTGGFDWVFDENGLVALVEFESRANSDNGPKCHQEHWIHWSPVHEHGLSSCSSEMIEKVKPCIEAFKQKEAARQPLLNLDTVTPQPSAVLGACPETKAESSDC